MVGSRFGILCTVFVAAFLVGGCTPPSAPAEFEEPPSAQADGSAQAGGSTQAGGSAEADGSGRASGDEPAIAEGSASPPPVTPEPADPLVGVDDPSLPLPSVAAEQIASIRPDPPPDEIIRNTHYWTSNETAHWVWREDLTDLGGAWVGVGTDQNYLLAGWARPALLILMDFDVAIADLHRAYGAAFREATDIEAFRALWNEDDAESLVAAIRRHYADDPEGVAATVARLEHAFSTVSRRIERVQELYQDLDIACYLTDSDQYDFLRQLWQHGRVLAIRGDLTADRTMLDIAQTLDAIEVPLRGLYVSNAEQYFDYEAEFRRNILAMPVDDRSLLLRTTHAARYGTPEGEEDYHFNAQPLTNFAHYMRVSEDVDDMWRMMREREDSDTVGFSRITAAPEPDDEPPEIAPMPPSHPTP